MLLPRWLLNVKRRMNATRVRRLRNEDSESDVLPRRAVKALSSVVKRRMNATRRGHCDHHNYQVATSAIRHSSVPQCQKRVWFECDKPPPRVAEVYYTQTLSDGSCKT